MDRNRLSRLKQYVEFMESYFPQYLSIDKKTILEMIKDFVKIYNRENKDQLFRVETFSATDGNLWLCGFSYRQMKLAFRSRSMMMSGSYDKENEEKLSTEFIQSFLHSLVKGINDEIQYRHLFNQIEDSLALKGYYSLALDEQCMARALNSAALLGLKYTLFYEGYGILTDEEYPQAVNEVLGPFLLQHSDVCTYEM